MWRRVTPHRRTGPEGYWAGSSVVAAIGTGGGAATTSGTDWSFVGVRLGGLAALALICTMFATRAFRSYQRSV